MNEIQYIKGDATDPKGEGKKLLIHCCNDVPGGAWGAGFVVALSKKWPEPESHYRDWATKGSYLTNSAKIPYALGFIQPVQVEKDIAVVNMIGQHNTGRDKYGFAPIRYWAIDECLKKVANIAKKHECSVHAPYLMGCALAGGEWDYVELMLKKRLVNQGISVTAYDFDGIRG